MPQETVWNLEQESRDSSRNENDTVWILEPESRASSRNENHNGIRPLLARYFQIGLCSWDTSNLEQESRDSSREENDTAWMLEQTATCNLFFPGGFLFPAGLALGILLEF